MTKRLWQATMIGMARAATLKSIMQSWGASTLLARQFVAGKDASEAVERARELRSGGIDSSLFYLGEYVDTLDLVELNVLQKSRVIAALAKAGLDVHVSVDPTQIGHSIDPSLCRKHAFTLATEIAQAARQVPNGMNCLMIDMEDAAVVDTTIELHNELLAAGLPVAQTLQAYLRRTESDMRDKIRSATKVRLVKGAFAAGADIAFVTRREIKANYRALAHIMLSREARSNGFYPIFATHDNVLQDDIIRIARQEGWNPGEYEFEMLLGARKDVAQRLAQRGERIRLYTPFGEDWWPYAMRRVGENPRNVMLLARAILARA